MKKFLIVFLAVVLTLSLCLVACKPDGDQDDVTISVEPLNLKVGETPDFNGHVIVKVNDVEVQNPKITWTLSSGDESVAGTCFYKITFEHNGQQYTTNTARVTFTVDTVVLTGYDFYQYIANEIVWKNHVTVKVNNTQVTASEFQANFSAVIKQGTVAAGNDVVYTVTYTHAGTDFTKDITVTYTDVDPDDVDLIDVLFTADYHSYTVEYNWDLPDYGESIIETDKVLWDTENEEILYEILSVGDTDWLYYVVESEENLRFYDNYGTETDDWQFKIFSWDTDEEEIDKVYPYCYAPDDVTIDKNIFIKVANGKYQVKADYLTDAANVLFPYNYYEDYTTFTKIVLETDGTYVTKITGEYVDTEYGPCTVSYTWSDVGTTNVSLPEDAIEYVAFAPLTPEQTTNVQAAVVKTYDSITYSFYDIKDSLIWIGEDPFISYMCDGKITPNATYDDVYYFVVWGSYPVSLGSQTTLFAATDEANGMYYIFDNEQGDYHGNTVSATVAEATTYIAFADFGLTADLFGWSTVGRYVMSAEALADTTVKDKILNNIWWMPTESLHSSTELSEFTFKLDSKNNVTEWSLTLNCVFQTDDGSAGDSVEIRMACFYEDFNETTINMPAPVVGTTIDDDTDVNNALEADYSNVTIVDHGNNSTMYFDGEGNVHVTGYNYDEYGDPESEWSRDFVIGSEGDNKTYKEIVAGFIEEAGDPSDPDHYFFYNVLCFDFSVLKGHLKYDAEKDIYVCHVADYPEFDNDLFAYYWTDFWGAGMEIEDIELTIEDGHVTFVRMYTSVEKTDSETQESFTMHATMSATLSDFGTTVFPADETEESED